MEMSVTNFVRVRRDGKKIYEETSVNEMISWGEPSKVVEVFWTSSGENHVIVSKSGFVASILPEKDGIVVFEFLEDGGKTLRIINEDGSVRFYVPDKLSIGGENVAISFGWRRDVKSKDDTIEFTFSVPEKDLQYSASLNVKSGDVSDILPYR